MQGSQQNLRKFVIKPLFEVRPSRYQMRLSEYFICIHCPFALNSRTVRGVTDSLLFFRVAHPVVVCCFSLDSSEFADCLPFGDFGYPSAVILTSTCFKDLFRSDEACGGIVMGCVFVRGVHSGTWARTTNLTVPFPAANNAEFRSHFAFGRESNAGSDFWYKNYFLLMIFLRGNVSLRGTISAFVFPSPKLFPFN